MNRLISFLRRRAYRMISRRKPDFVIGPPEEPYLRRWWLIPRNSFFNIYLHEILQDDPVGALHDHPYANCSLILDGGYVEELVGNRHVWRPAGTVIFRRARTAHRIILAKDWRYGAHAFDRKPFRIPALTILLTGPRLRGWGFHAPDGWVPWQCFSSKQRPAEADRIAVSRK